MAYGTGAIFGCPAHDQRDLDFARYGLALSGGWWVIVRRRSQGVDAEDRLYRRGDLTNSDFLDGLSVAAAKAEVARRLERWRRTGSAGERRSTACCATGGSRGSAIGVVRFRWCIASCGVVPFWRANCPSAARRRGLTSRVTRWRTTRRGRHRDAHSARSRAARNRHARPFVDSSWYFARFAERVNTAEAPRSTPTSRKLLASGGPVYRRHRARHVASLVFALLHARAKNSRVT